MLDGGGSYVPSRWQQVVWSKWEEFFGEWVPRMTKREPYGIVFNGDLIDGDHHDTKTLITRNFSDQIRIAESCYTPFFNKAEVLYITRGTEAHAGKCHEWEELLAQRIGAKPDRDGFHSRRFLQLYIGAQRALVDVRHHIATVQSDYQETTALMKEFVNASIEAARWGRPLPDAIVRSHCHFDREIIPRTHRGDCPVLSTAGWQLLTPHLDKHAKTRQATPQVGGVVLRTDGHMDRVYALHKVWSLCPDEPEAPEVEDVKTRSRKR